MISEILSKYNYNSYFYNNTITATATATTLLFHLDTVAELGLNIMAMNWTHRLVSIKLRISYNNEQKRTLILLVVRVCMYT
jgi:hypothetical protein